MTTRRRARADTWYETRRMQMLGDLAGDGRVLDIGYAQMPNEYFDAAHVTGIDLDEADAPGYDVTTVGDAGDPTTLPGQTFDSVVAGELIEHLEDPYGFLRSLHPLIAPGGQLLLSTPNPVSVPVVLAEWFRSRRVFYTTDHVFYFPPRWVDRMLERAGYEVVAHHAVGLWMPPLRIRRCPIGLSYQVIYVAVPTPSQQATA